MNIFLHYELGLEITYSTSLSDTKLAIYILLQPTARDFQKIIHNFTFCSSYFELIKS